MFHNYLLYILVESNGRPLIFDLDATYLFIFILLFECSCVQLCDFVQYGYMQEF